MRFDRKPKTYKKQCRNEANHGPYLSWQVFDTCYVTLSVEAFEGYDFHDSSIACYSQARMQNGQDCCYGRHSLIIYLGPRVHSEV
jgi:hypothetical protein